MRHKIEAHSPFGGTVNKMGKDLPVLSYMVIKSAGVGYTFKAL